MAILSETRTRIEQRKQNQTKTYKNLNGSYFSIPKKKLKPKLESNWELNWHLNIQNMIYVPKVLVIIFKNNKLEIIFKNSYYPNIFIGFLSSTRILSDFKRTPNPKCPNWVLFEFYKKIEIRPNPTLLEPIRSKKMFGS